MNPVLLRLYPAGFRHAFGEEIADSYREATEGMGRHARLREAADVVAHALRLRLGIGSAHPGGRLLAAVAPFGLAATGAYAAFDLIGGTADWYVMGAPGHGGPLVTPMNACYLLSLLGALVALAGWYRSGVLCSIAGAAGSSVAFLQPIWGLPFDLRWQLVGYLVTPVAVAVLPLLCPPDLRPLRRVRSTAGVFALVMWAVLLVAAVTVIDPLGIGLLLPWRLGIPVAAALLLAGRRAFARIRTTTQLIGAAVPFIVILYFSGWAVSKEILAAVGAVTVTAVAMRLRRGGKSDTVNPA